MRTLAESENIIIQSEFETVELEFKRGIGLKKRSVIIGDFYGDPKCAIISDYGNFCAVGGCGIIIYWIRNPLKEYDYSDKQTNQYQGIFGIQTTVGGLIPSTREMKKIK